MSEMITPSWQDAAERTMKALELSDTKVADLVTQLDATTARAEQAEARVKELEGCMDLLRRETQQAEDTEELYRKEANDATSELANVKGDLETTRRALEEIAFSDEVDGLSANPAKWPSTIAYRALGGRIVNGQCIDTRATLAAPDGQQVTADGHVADEAALEISNEAIRPAPSYTLEDLERMKAEIQSEARECSSRLDSVRRMANG